MNKQPVTMLENFRLGMDRELPEWKKMIEGKKINLGAGKKFIEGTEPLDFSNGWTAPILPCEDNSISGIYAYHFLEHLEKDIFLQMIMECERVLVVGGLMNVVVPWAGSQVAYDLDHKLFFNEKSFKKLFDNPYYQGAQNYTENFSPRKWKMKVNSVCLMGIVERNIAVITQLEKI